MKLDLSGAELDAWNLSDVHLTELRLDRAVIYGDLNLYGVQIDGGLELSGTRIAGSLRVGENPPSRGSSLASTTTVRSTIGGSLHMASSARIEGWLTISKSSLRKLHLEGGTQLTGGITFEDQAEINSAVILDEAHVGGEFWIQKGSKIADNLIIRQNSHIKALWVDEATVGSVSVEYLTTISKDVRIGNHTKILRGVALHGSTIGGCVDLGGDIRGNVTVVTCISGDLTINVASEDSRVYDQISIGRGHVHGSLKISEFGTMSDVRLRRVDVRGDFWIGSGCTVTLGEGVTWSGRGSRSLPENAQPVELPNGEFKIVNLSEDV